MATHDEQSIEKEWIRRRNLVPLVVTVNVQTSAFQILAGQAGRKIKIYSIVCSLENQGAGTESVSLFDGTDEHFFFYQDPGATSQIELDLSWAPWKLPTGADLDVTGTGATIKPTTIFLMYEYADE